MSHTSWEQAIGPHDICALSGTKFTWPWCHSYSLLSAFLSQSSPPHHSSKMQSVSFMSAAWSFSLNPSLSKEPTGNWSELAQLPCNWWLVVSRFRACCPGVPTSKPPIQTTNYDGLPEKDNSALREVVPDLSGLSGPVAARPYRLQSSDSDDAAWRVMGRCLCLHRRLRADHFSWTASGNLEKAKADTERADSARSLGLAPVNSFRHSMADAGVVLPKADFSRHRLQNDVLKRAGCGLANKRLEAPLAVQFSPRMQDSR